MGGIISALRFAHYLTPLACSRVFDSGFHLVLLSPIKIQQRMYGLAQNMKLEAIKY